MILRASVLGLITTLVLLSLSVWFGSIATRRLDEVFEARTDSVAHLGGALLEFQANVIEKSFLRLAARSGPTLPESSWQADAQRYLSDHPGLNRIAWTRASGAPWTASSSESQPTAQLPWVPTDSRELAWQFGGTSVQLAIPAADGGWISATFETQTTFEKPLHEPGVFAAHEFAILDSETAPESRVRWARSEQLTSPFRCRLEAVPLESDQTRLRRLLPGIIYASLISLSCIAGLGVALGATLRFQARNLTRANQQLTEFNEQLDELVRVRTREMDRARIAALNVAKDTESRALALEKSESKLRSVLESATDGILMVDESYVVRTANPAALGLFRRTHDEVVGTKLSDLITGLPAPTALRPLPGSHVLFDGRLSAIRPDGTEIALSVSIAQTPSGTRTVVLGDLSRWLAAEARFQEVVESSPSALVMISPDGNINMVNSATERMFGYDYGELIDQPIESLIPHRFREEHPALRDQFFEDPKNRAMGANRDLYAVRKDGSEFPVEIGLSPIDTEDGVMALGAVVDLTERKLSELSLQRYASELESKNRDLDSFAHAVSHDLKAPLRGITSIAQWTIEDYSEVLDEEGRDNLRLMHQRCQRLSRLIDGILEYSRIGRESRNPVLLDTKRAFEETLSLLGVPDGIQVHLSSELPVVLFDQIQFQQVIQNLLSNAIKYMGSDTGTIDVEVTDEPQHWVFRVSDTGEGIDPKHFDRIFAVFQTLRPRDELESTGVGLSVVKRIVELGGGEVWLESEPGRGTDFFFSVPKTPPKALDYDTPREHLADSEQTQTS